MKLITLSLVCAFCLCAQTETSLIATGYSAPAPTEVAPGQVVTIFFRGVPALPSGFPRLARAESVPLPTTLAGLSITLMQQTQSAGFKLPILAVEQHNDCEEITGKPACYLTSVRVQIPVELNPIVSKLTLEHEGQVSRTFLIRPIRDNSHVITSCDLTWDTNPGTSCARLAFHANGTVVDSSSPATPGETLIVYAHGLGVTMPRAVTGQLSPAGAAVIEATSRQIGVSFEFFRNAAPAVPVYPAPNTMETLLRPSFVGLTPNQVGLYQLNIEVPRSLDIAFTCGGDTRSNVLLKVATSRGVENIAICVAP